MLFYKSVFWQAILYQYLYFLCFSLLNPKEEKRVDDTSCCVTILTRAASNIKKNVEVLTQHSPSAFLSLVALQMSRDALSRNAGDILQTVQH